jgi:hypothetical protein
MKRTSLLEYDDASPEVRATYDEIMETMGSTSVLNFLKALGHNPHVLRAVWTMLRETVIEGEIPALLNLAARPRSAESRSNPYLRRPRGIVRRSLQQQPSPLVSSGDRGRLPRLSRSQECRRDGMGFRKSAQRRGFLRE